ncbi:PP2C family protein-serine/threonine phosphatase [Nocardia sp. alder85J]|uniref:PP2C family protein-serine/threonine phosphatase n=1 Tax=Nocardia sp. alder85J TaxID=2862949 RepID=UPI001CD7036F|nr:zinc ribbon domain-containing protein [Nocardia sp. alder85J]MCX4093267.1 zinc ribbon domain-containing protein [Nocardia sp. alder85J]
MTAATRRCPACGSDIAGPADRFCENCGRDLGATADPPAPTPPPPAAAVTGYAVLPLTAAAAATPCDGCGGTGFDADGYCAGCGELRSPPDAGSADLGAIQLSTHRGKVHAHNEDAVAATVVADPANPAGPVAIVVLCDGVSTSSDPQAASGAASRSGVDGIVAALAAGWDPVQATRIGLDAAFEAVRATAGGHHNAPSCTYVSAVVRRAPARADVATMPEFPVVEPVPEAGAENGWDGPDSGAPQPDAGPAIGQYSAEMSSERTDFVALPDPEAGVAPERAAAEAAPGREAAEPVEYEVTVANVGDSRGYWLTGSESAQSRRLTVDDSWAQLVVAAGQLDEAAAMRDPRAHALVRWLGADSVDSAATTEVHTHRVRGPGVVLLCSDGLWNYLPAADDLAMVATATAAGAAAHALVDFALDGGGSDNITVALVPVPLPGRPHATTTPWSRTGGEHG